MNLLPTPKVATGGLTGIIVSFIMYELSNRFHITLAPEEASFITAFASVAASYFAPHSDPTPEQVNVIKQQACADPILPQRRVSI